MTKVEELRELRDALDDLIETEASKILTAHQFLKLPGFDKIMDAIVAVSHAKGVEVGIERERERILSASVGTTAIDITAGTIEHPTVNDTLYWHTAYLIPFSILAPKEITP